MKLIGLIDYFCRKYKRMYMKRYILWALPLCLIALMFQSCDHQKSYADMLKDEKKQIEQFIRQNNIDVITPNTFYAQDSTTDVSRNQYVLFKDDGVYMQIIDKGNGQVVEDGDFITVRFTETNLSTGDSISTIGISDYLDEFRYTKSGTSVKGKFIDTRGGMYGTYGSAVPAGWLLPLEYVKLGINVSDRARVKLIVPAKMGQPDAIQYIYPCYYELFYQLPKQ